jgi:hypothetical protein
MPASQASARSSMLHSDEFIKSIKRYERRIRRPRSIFDIIDSIGFFAKPHQGITPGQKAAFEIAQRRALDYVSLYNLDMRMKFPTDAQAKNRLWRENIVPMLQKAKNMTREGNDTCKTKADAMIATMSSGHSSRHQVKPNAKLEHRSLLENCSGQARKTDLDRQTASAIQSETDKKTEQNIKCKQCVPIYFTLLPEWILESIGKKKAFEMIPELVLDFAIDHRDMFGKWLQVPSKVEICDKNNIKQYLYLVFCELNDYSFYKVGLTKHKNPIRRDPNVYKRVISCHEVESDWAHIYEMYCLWRCKQVRGKQPWDSIEFGWWPGKSEMIRSVEQGVESLFSEAYSELQAAKQRLNINQVLFEWYLLDSLVKAVYDERYASSALAVYSFIDKIAYHFGEQHGDADDCEKVNLHPAARKYLTKRLVHQLAPIVDRKWDEQNIRCPVNRYHMGKRLYEAWCLETWGETCWSNAKPYRNMITSNSLQDTLKEKLDREYKASIDKVFVKQVPAQKPPIQLTDLSSPCLPTIKKKEKSSCKIAYPDKLIITYQDLFGDITVREISIVDETLQSVDAFCYLRQEKRTFNIWSIVSVLQEDGTECWGPKYFYNFRLGSVLDMKRSMSFSIELYHEAHKIAAKVKTRSQLADLEKKVCRAEGKILEAKTDRAHDIACEKSSLLQEAHSIALGKNYEAQYQPDLTSQDSLFLTLLQLAHAYKTVPIDSCQELRSVHPQLSNKHDWSFFRGDDSPDAYSVPLEVLKCLVKFRKIIEGGHALEEQLRSIDLLAYSQAKVFNNYFDLRGNRRPSEQWLILVAEKSQ